MPISNAPPDDEPGYIEALEGFRAATATVDKNHPDVQKIVAHAVVAVSAVLNDADDVATENDELAAKNRELTAATKRLRRAIGATTRKLDDALAAAKGTRTALNVERALRRAEQARDAAEAQQGQAPPGGVGEMPGDGSACERGEGEGADHEADGEATRVERALHVVRQDREIRPDGQQRQ